MSIFDAYLGLSAKSLPSPQDDAGFLGLAPQRQLPEIHERGFRTRQSHVPRGFPVCAICGQLSNEHEIRDRRVEKELWKKASKKKKKSEQKRRILHQEIDEVFFGIDGEGRGRYPHIYTLLAAVDEDGERMYIENEKGLSTVECLEFFLDMPETHYVFAYAFGYDLTKILADVDNETLYLLFRPELRARSGKLKGRGPRPVLWNGYELNLQSSRFEVRKDGTVTVIWDIFKFFQSKFVNALKDWKVGNEALWERMSAMKLQRGEFENVDAAKVRDYCLEECLCMAQLARKLVNAHDDAGLSLTNFYGAGSSASAMLKKMGIKEMMVEPPDEMRNAIASAFFGGRFENSVIGEIEGPVYNHDISSAYPYQTYHLPCLVHATWRRTNRESDLEDAQQALVRYSLDEYPKISHWAPLPFRGGDGNICYPYVSGGGWVWVDEFKAARAGFPKNVKFHEAWILETDCDCHPFKQIAYYYKERCRIGKEGPGIVMKLGCNSVYGKIAQSVGNGIFNNWAWAGMITSGCRAQLLNVICAHEDRSNCLMVATDGVFTKENLKMPVPKDTGTWDAMVDGVAKPLGGWETKTINQNVFIARPGIYFPMNPTKKQLKEVKGRGVGKSVVFDNWKLISDSWNEYGLTRPVEVANVTRFCGAKTSMSRRIRSGLFEYHRADGERHKDDEPDYQPPMYGEWVERKVAMSFDPLPKRAAVMKDGRSLALRERRSMHSTAYRKAGLCLESAQMKAITEEMLEQPDVDLCEVE
jgi:hypothetical protein